MTVVGVCSCCGRRAPGHVLEGEFVCEGCGGGPDGEGERELVAERLERELPRAA